MPRQMCGPKGNTCFLLLFLKSNKNIEYIPAVIKAMIIENKINFHPNIKPQIETNIISPPPNVFLINMAIKSIGMLIQIIPINFVVILISLKTKHDIIAIINSVICKLYGISEVS